MLPSISRNDSLSTPIPIIPFMQAQVLVVNGKTIVRPASVLPVYIPSNLWWFILECLFDFFL